MSEIFISYSRKNQVFVRRLYTKLTELRREVWVDWEAIQVTDDWWQAIRIGIEASDNFIFIISPNSLASPVCHLEIACALHCEKRLIPIIYAPIDEKSAFEALALRILDVNTQALIGGQDLLALAKRNWLSLAGQDWLVLRDDMGFESNFQKLIAVIDGDINRCRNHKFWI